MKTICVPKDSLAQTRLDFDEAKPDELMELKIDDSIFKKLWDVGFFNSINKLTHSNIDNFEDECISERDQLMKVLNSNLFDKKLYAQELHQVIDGINDLFTKAITYRTGIYFYF